MARRADLDTEKQCRDLIVAGATIKDIWHSLREHKLSRSRIVEIRDEIASPRGLKWACEWPVVERRQTAPPPRPAQAGEGAVARSTLHPRYRRRPHERSGSMIIELTAAAIGGSIIGFLGCAVLTAGKVADAQSSGIKKCVDGEWVHVSVDEMWETATFHSDNHARCADALSTNQAKLEAVRELLKTPRTIRKKDLWAIVGRGCAE